MMKHYLFKIQGGILIGYSFGIRWTDKKIEEEILRVNKKLEINRMPTSVEILRVSNSSALSNAIRRHGGYKYWADKLELNQSECETRLGLFGELKAKEILENKEYKVDKMPVKHPYDLLVNKNIKIDTKVSKLFDTRYYTFNLEKSNPTCDIYVAFCIDDDLSIKKTYVIPSKFLHLTQLSIGETSSRYDEFIDKWEYVDQFNEFYESIK